MRARELGLLLPLLALYAAATLLFPSHPDDEASYLTLATRLQHGAYVTGNDQALLDTDPTSPDLWFGPGLPGVITPLVALDAPINVVRMVGPLFLFGAMLLFFVLARDRAGPRSALLATYALGVYPPFWALLPNLHSEPPAILCIVAGMLGLSRYLESGRLRWFAFGAVALAGLALTRVAYGWVLTILLIALSACFLFRRSGAILRAIAVVGTALVLCLPWLAYTSSVTGQTLVWGNSGSLSLYWMASPYPGDRGDWHQADDVFSDPALEPHRSFFTSLRGLSLAEQNVRIQRKALRNIRDHPAHYGENLLANASRMFFNGPYSAERWKPNDLFYALPNALVLVALAFSAATLVPRWRALPAAALPIGGLGAVALLVHVALATYPRMLMPIVPIVAWFTVLAFAERRSAERVNAARADTPTPSPSG